MRVPKSAKRSSWAVHDKNRLVAALMEELAGNAHGSFEGSLSGYKLVGISGASQEETIALKRHTIWPKEDFVVIPLEPGMGNTILSAVGGTLSPNIMQIQIEKAGVLEFGAYDNFDANCVFFGGLVTKPFLESLASQGILKSSA